MSTSASVDCDDRQSDFDYEKTLIQIRSSIMNINKSIFYLNQNKMLLSKLCNAGSDEEKLLRNHYLNPLSHQGDQQIVITANPPAIVVPFKISKGDCKLPDFSTAAEISNSSSWTDLSAEAETVSILSLNNDCEDCKTKIVTDLNNNNEEPLNLNDVNSPFKYTTFTDYTKTVESLQLRVNETTKENDELKALLKANNCKHYLAKLEGEQARMSLKELHKKNIEELNKKHATELLKFESACAKEVKMIQNNCDARIAKVTQEGETKLNNLQKELDLYVDVTEKQIEGLKTTYAEQCQNNLFGIQRLRSIANKIIGNRNETIRYLQNRMFQVDRLYSKLEKEYFAELRKLQNSIAIKEEISQTPVIATEKPFKNCDNLVDNLENHFKNMMTLQAEHMQQLKHANKQQYDELIELWKQKSNF